MFSLLSSSFVRLSKSIPDSFLYYHCQYGLHSLNVTNKYKWSEDYFLVWESGFLPVGLHPVSRENSEIEKLELAETSLKLTFGIRKIIITDEELERLEAKYKEYINEMGVDFGFVSYLLGADV